LNATNRTEALQQRLGASGPDPGDIDQLGGEGSLTAPLTVAGDGETVGLVTRLTEDEVGGVRMFETQRLGRPGQPDLLLAFGEPCHGELEVERVDGRHGRVELADTAVDEHQIGHIRVLVPQSAVPSGHGFSDGGEVIDAND